MEDREIVALYWRRDETAVAETAAKYGAFCRRIAGNILRVREDAEECVNDTWHHAWNAMPPQRPDCLRAFLGRIARNLALNRRQSGLALRRGGGLESLLGELDECVPSPVSVERTLEAKELAEFLGRWLDSLAPEDRALFLRRYWCGDALDALAAAFGIPAGRLAQRMFRLRARLRATLEKEGYAL